LIDGLDIAILLREHPELIDDVDITRLDGVEIAFLLSEQPQFIKRFDVTKLSGFNSFSILKSQPQLVCDIDTSKIQGDLMSSLLETHPQLIEHFDISTISSFTQEEMDSMDGRSIYLLLRCEPHVISKVDTSKMSTSHIEMLIKHKPSLSKYFN
jgi:hypothetical protein